MPENNAVTAAFALLPTEQRYALASYFLDVRDSPRLGGTRASDAGGFTHDDRTRDMANEALIMLVDAQGIAHSAERNAFRASLRA